MVAGTRRDAQVVPPPVASAAGPFGRTMSRLSRAAVLVERQIVRFVFLVFVVKVANRLRSGASRRVRLRPTPARPPITAAAAAAAIFGQFALDATRVAHLGAAREEATARHDGRYFGRRAEREKYPLLDRVAPKMATSRRRRTLESDRVFFLHTDVTKVLYSRRKLSQSITLQEQQQQQQQNTNLGSGILDGRRQRQPKLNREIYIDK